MLDLDTWRISRRGSAAATTCARALRMHASGIAMRTAMVLPTLRRAEATRTARTQKYSNGQSRSICVSHSRCRPLVASALSATSTRIHNGEIQPSARGERLLRRGLGLGVDEMDQSGRVASAV